MSALSWGLWVRWETPDDERGSHLALGRLHGLRTRDTERVPRRLFGVRVTGEPLPVKPEREYDSFRDAPAFPWPLPAR